MANNIQPKKKRLLKAPENDGEILFLSRGADFFSSIDKNKCVGVCHQPGFFNPGVALKFIMADLLPECTKKNFFLDTDRVRVSVNIPSEKGPLRIFLAESECAFSRFPMPEINEIELFFNSIESHLKFFLSNTSSEAMSSFYRFREIFYRCTDVEFLKEALAESFLEFYNKSGDYIFVSDFLSGDDYKEFCEIIIKNHNEFREIFNEALDDYKKEFRFRYKNYPFPKLRQNELPFWTVKNNTRKHSYVEDVESASGNIFFPRAVTLTLFLRLYKLDFFIHGIGGGNYEWIADCMIENFFKREIPPYTVISGTFLMENYEKRDLPYFLIPPERIIKAVKCRRQTAGNQK
jgi:hypothetical protein